jgi:hypothetical protein
LELTRDYPSADVDMATLAKLEQKLAVVQKNTNEMATDIGLYQSRYFGDLVPWDYVPPKAED